MLWSGAYTAPITHFSSVKCLCEALHGEPARPQHTSMKSEERGGNTEGVAVTGSNPVKLSPDTLPSGQWPG
jgi:hypothetical protein